MASGAINFICVSSLLSLSVLPPFDLCLYVYQCLTVYDHNPPPSPLHFLFEMVILEFV